MTWLTLPWSWNSARFGWLCRDPCKESRNRLQCMITSSLAITISVWCACHLPYNVWSLLILYTQLFWCPWHNLPIGMSSADFMSTNHIPVEQGKQNSAIYPILTRPLYLYSSAHCSSFIHWITAFKSCFWTCHCSAPYARLLSFKWTESTNLLTPSTSYASGNCGCDLPKERQS